MKIYMALAAALSVAGCATSKTTVLPPYALANGVTLQDVITIGSNGEGTAPVVTKVSTYRLGEDDAAELVSSVSGSEGSIGSVITGALVGGATQGATSALASRLIAQGNTSGGTTVNTTVNLPDEEEGPPAASSDRRLKRDIVRLGKLANGLGIYRFRYLWSDEVFVGVMAQEARGVMPEAVIMGADGFMRVHYGRLGIEMLSWQQWQARLDAGVSPSQGLLLGSGAPEVELAAAVR